MVLFKTLVTQVTAKRRLDPKMQTDSRRSKLNFYFNKKRKAVEGTNLKKKKSENILTRTDKRVETPGLDESGWSKQGEWVESGARK